MMRDPEMVHGEIKLPFVRKLGCVLGHLGMQLGVPFASQLYFRCLLGKGVSFSVVQVDIEDQK